MTDYLIIGDGAAGIAAAETVRGRDPQATLTVISDDPQPHYYRAALTNYLIGQLRDEQLWGVPPDFYQRNRIGRFFGRVTAVRAEQARVELENGLAVPYDRLLIASGAAAVPLAAPGATLPEVMTFRTLRDVRRLLDAVPAAKRAVVVGAGPLGLEWVQGLRHHGVEVTYVLRERGILPRVLDAEASELVFRRLRAAGVTLVLGDEIAEIHPGPDGHVAGVTTKAGRQIPCGLVGAAIGASPNVGFLRGGPVAINRGVLTDRRLSTNVAGVYAAGDVAHIVDLDHGLDLPSTGLWQPARKQGQIAGANMAAATPAQEYQPGLVLHATHLFDLDFASVGETNPRPGEGVDVFTARPGPDAYAKVAVHGAHVTGALFVGDRRRAMLFKRLIDMRLDVSAVRGRLLDPRFDLAAWVERARLAAAPRPARRSSVVRPRGAGDAPADPRGLAAPVVVAVAPPPGATPLLAHRAARLVAGGNVYALPADRPAIIGREPDCVVMLGNTTVSRHHAEILGNAAGYAVTDLGSTNGTWVGLARLQPHVPQLLRDGDAVRFGEVFLTFSLVNDNAATAPPPSTAVLAGPGGVAPLLPEVTSLGRDLTGDIVVPEPRASRLHAQIRRAADGGYYLNDMGSANGTLVNGAPLRGVHRLADGDEIAIGGSRYVFHADASTARAGALRSTGVLTALSGSDAGTRYPLTKGESILGRDTSSDIQFNDSLVSRAHAVIRMAGGVYTIEDRGSRNGTRVNGEPLTAARRLAANDVVEIGQTRLVFRIESSGGPAPANALAAATRVILPSDVTSSAQHTLRVGRAAMSGGPALVLAGGDHGDRRYRLAAGGAIIGRDPAGAIVLDGDTVSWQHAGVEHYADGRVVIRPLSGRAVTAVNGEPLHGPRLLMAGDTVQIAGHQLRFVLE